MSTSWRLILLISTFFLGAFDCGAQDKLDGAIQKNLDGWVGTYKQLHANPELSGQEKETSALIAGELKKLGYEVTDHIGKYSQADMTPYGVVGVLHNGAGPTVYVRTDMDALPVTENTGLAYASHAKVKRANDEVGVMHACGHDLHMTVFLGTARMIAENKSNWSGTVVMIGQPAEEAVGGARAMLNDGLFTRFPKPDYVIALHDSPFLPAGKVAWKEGTLLAGSNTVDITVRGYGGHGAAPFATKDPIVIASELVVMLQTIVSREMNPLEPTVVTVGSFHAGTKHNIIPDEAHLQLSVRTMTPQHRDTVIAAIKRITQGVAEAAGVPQERAPIVEVADGVPATVNDPALARRIGAALETSMGKGNVETAIPIMASEDFSLYALSDPKPPTTMIWLGAADPAKIKEASEKGTRLPSLHSSEFAPLPAPAIAAGVKAMSSIVFDLLKKPN